MLIQIRFPAALMLCAGISAISAAIPVPAQAQIVAQPAAVLPAYTTIADLILAAPAVLDIRVRSSARIKGPEAVGVAADHARFYIEADVLALIRSNTPLPARVGYVVDVPLDA